MQSRDSGLLSYDLREAPRGQLVANSPVEEPGIL